MIKSYKISIFITIAAVLTISLFWFMPSLAFIIFLSVLLAIFLKPFVDIMAKKIPRSFAAGVALLTFLSVFVLLLTVVTQSFLPAFTDFITDFPNISRQFYEQTSAWNLEFITTDLDNVWNELFNTGISAIKSSLGLILSLFNKVIDGVIILFVTFYFIKDDEIIKSEIANMFPAKNQERIARLIENVLKVLHAYLNGQLIVCLNTGLIVFLYYFLRDIPYAPVFAVISCVAEFIPVLGPTIASLFGILVTLTISPALSAQTALFYLILTQVNHNIVYPNIIGKSLNLHPIAIILSIVLGGELLGATGMFLAVPIITVCKIIIADIYNDYLSKAHD